jgi:hypothetical protein
MSALRDRLDHIPWPLRSIASGTCGTAVMGLTYAVERRLRRSPIHTPLDYDDSDVPGKIVVSILHLGQVTEKRDRQLGLALRWSYGSVFGLYHGLLRRRTGEPWATLGFLTTLLAATLSLFPLLGRTPPPWRWSRAYLLTCVITHAAYAATVGAVDDALSDRPVTAPASEESQEVELSS